MLLYAEEIPRAAIGQILAGNRKAVRTLLQDAQPFLSGSIGDKVAIRRQASAADPAAQLVQLRQPEAVCVLHNHNRRVRHIHANLYNRCGNEHRDLPRCKAPHDLRFFLRTHAPVQDADAPGGIALLQPLPHLLHRNGGNALRRLQQRADDIRFFPCGHSLR